MSQLIDDKKTRISYDNFIFNYQFQRRIPIGLYMYTRTSLVSLFLGLSGSFSLHYFHFIEYQWYPFVLSVFFLVWRFPRVKLTFDSRIGMIHKNRTNDEDEKSILIFSKITWFQKKYYNNKKKERNIKKVEES